MEWDGVFEITNNSDRDLDIKTIEIDWDARMLDRGDTLELRARVGGDNGGLVEVYNSMVDFRTVDNSSDRDRRKMDLVEHFPVSIPAHGKKILVVWYINGIFHREKMQSATDYPTLFRGLAKILDLVEPNGDCRVGKNRETKVTIVTTSGRRIEKRVPLVLLIPGCKYSIG